MKKLFASKYWWLFLLILFFGVNFVASVFHSRFDLTKEKRYTLSRATKQMLGNLESPVTIDVFLKGDFPAGFKKLAGSVQEFLQECKEYGKDNLRFRFIDPFKKANDSAENFLKETRALIIRDSSQVLRDTTQSFLSQARLAVLSSKNERTDKEIVQEFATLLMEQ